MSILFGQFVDILYLCIVKKRVDNTQNMTRIINKVYMKERLLMMMMVCAITMSASGQKKWTLKACIDYAMQNNLELKQAELTRKSATEERKQSKAALLPSLTANTNQNVVYSPWINSGSSGVKVDKTSYSGTYGVNAQWTVWDGNQNRNQLKLSELNEQQAELQKQEQANTIQEQIAKLYVQILYMNEAIGVHQQSVATSKKNEERGKQMVEVGKMSKADLAQLSAQRSTDEYNLVEAESNLKNYIIQLKQLLELSDEEFSVATPTASDQQALAAIPAMNDVYEQAVSQRPEIKNTELTLKQSDLQAKIAKAGYLPTVSLTGGVGTSTSSANDRGWGMQMKTNFDATAGIGVSIPLLDQRKTKTAINKAKLQREQALLTLKNEKDNLYDTIETLWIDALANQQKFKAASATVESEQQSYDLLSEQFNLGLKNIVELMTGKTNLLQAQQNKLQSKYMTILSVQLLKFYQGENMEI